MNEKQSVGRRLLDGWMAIAGRFGAMQTLALLGLFYVFLIGPFSIAIAAVRKDLLDKRAPHAPGTAWKEADTAAPSLERAKLAS